MLKIGGFYGKFAEPGTQPEVQAPVVLQPTTKKAADSSRVKPDPSFKIKDSLREVSRAQPVMQIKTVGEQQEKVEARESFNEARVVAVLEKYVVDHRPEPTVAIALKSHQPIIEGEKINLLVDNQLQLDKLEALKIHLQNVLMKNLNNGFITIEFKMFDHKITHEEKKLFTASEKYEHFLKLNPVVADLKNIFGLELE